MNVVANGAGVSVKIEIIVIVMPMLTIDIVQWGHDTRVRLY